MKFLQKVKNVENEKYIKKERMSNKNFNSSIYNLSNHINMPLIYTQRNKNNNKFIQNKESGNFKEFKKIKYLRPINKKKQNMNSTIGFNEKKQNKDEKNVLIEENKNQENIKIEENKELPESNKENNNQDKENEKEINDKENQNPYMSKFNKKKEDEKAWIEEADKYEVKGNNIFQELNDGDKLNYSDIEYIKSKKIFSAPKTPQQLLKPIIKPNINNTLTAKKDIKEENKVEINENNNKIKPEIKDVKVCLDDIINDKNKIIDDNKNKDEIKDNKNKEEENKEETKETKEIKDPLLEDELEDKENIEDVITYLNGLDYDKYCKDMEIREALTLLKHKMDKEKEEKINAEENAQNKVTIEGVEKHDENQKKKIKY